MKTVIALLAPVSVVFAAAPLSVNASEEAGSTVQPLVVISDDNSHVAIPALEVVRTRDAWRRVWATHVGKDVDSVDAPTMDVDFDRCMVVATFRGQKVNTSKVSIESIARDEGTLRIRLSDVGYQSSGKGESKRPFAFVVLAKSDDGVVVEENVQRYLGRPPVWREWLRSQARDGDRKKR
jgi:hypothetical protein